MSGEKLVIPESEPPITPKAQREALGIANESLKPYTKIHKHIYRGAVCVFWTLLVVGLALGVVWAWHLGAPTRMRFLDPEQLSDLQKVLVSALGSSTLTGVARRILTNQRSDTDKG